jgi:uncharacterized membrane protein
MDDYTPNDPANPPFASEPMTPPPPAAVGGLSENTAAALCYVTIIPAIIFLLLEPYNRSAFVRFNAIQCLGLFVVSFVAHFILAIIPVIGWLLVLPLSLAVIVLWFICVLKAVKGQWYKLPVIGDLAMAQAKV